MKIKQTIIFLVSSVIAMFLALGFLFFVVRVIKNKNIHTLKVLETLKEKETQKQNIKTLQDKLKEFEIIQSDINNHFVDKAKIDLFVSFLEDLGTKSKSEIDVYTLDFSKKEKNTMNVGLSIKGSFSSVVQTIALLENTHYKLSIYSISLNTSDPSLNIMQVDDKNKPKNTWVGNVSFSILISD